MENNEELLAALDALAEQAELEATSLAVLREHIEEISKGLDEALALLQDKKEYDNE